MAAKDNWTSHQPNDFIATYAGREVPALCFCFLVIEFLYDLSFPPSFRYKDDDVEVMHMTAGIHEGDHRWRLNREEKATLKKWRAESRAQAGQS